MRLPLVVLLFVVAVIPGCRCGAPPVTTEPDSGGGAATCQSTPDCPLGQTCAEGACTTQAPVDSGFFCTRDADCPQGQACLKSTGQCVDVVVQDAGDEPLDAGDIGTCSPGQTQTCGSSKLGECKLGAQTCALVNGVWSFGDCVGAVDPATELCNGLDDDCDGQVDEGLGRVDCGKGECFRSTDSCIGGQSVTCTPGLPSAEVCDGKDNDCNGTVDDGLPDVSCGVGACRVTIPSCNGGVPDLCTPGSPTPEVCDGQDNDCNGTVDDGIATLTCGLGICARSSACVGGSQPACVSGTPLGAELCNGLDDTCDGRVDEGCSCTNGQVQSCYTGPAGTQGTLPCKTGTQTCDGGAWGACASQVVPVAEVCDGVDNDCNGTKDDGLGTASCGTGECARTVQKCVSGAPQTCTAGTPVAETCDGKDNDCNGLVDDALPSLSCGAGVCARTVASCAGGVPQTCTAGTPGTEVCNGLDDNCNGATDETFPQSGQACSTGKPGACATGTTSCTSGSLGCTQTVFPTSEVCGNGKDEDCNGVVDDPIVCGCASSIDNDFDGYNQCVDCNDSDGTMHPDAGEKCNGRDDNCNGKIDEGYDVDLDGFTTCGTADGGGIDPRRTDCNDSNAFVFPLKVTDCGNAATPTTANGVDDNCNGYADETCACTATDKDKDGVSSCAGDCNDNDPAIHPGAKEVCDGKDNDCNKATTENCGVSDPCGTKSGPSWVRFPAGTDECKPDLICVTNLATGALTCGSFCNQTVGLGLNDSCAAGEGCYRNLIDSDDLHLCSVLTTGAKTTGATCALASECRSGDCETGDGTTYYCTDKCTHEGGCSANTTCTVQKSPIVPGPGPQVIGYDYASFCRLDARLSGATVTGQPCTSTTACAGGTDMCVGGKCASPCCTHADCAAGSACTINGPSADIGYTSGGLPIASVVPACVATTAVRLAGAACTASAQCKSGLCDANQSICVDVCCNDTTCPNGTTCELVDLKLVTNRTTTIRACVFSPVPAQLVQK